MVGAAEIRPRGVGINALPHATAVLARPAVLPAMPESDRRVAGYVAPTARG